jgi:hypothetical protein
LHLLENSRRTTHPADLNVSRAALVDEPSEALRVGHVPLAQVPEHLELVAEANLGPGDGLVVRAELVGLGRSALVLLAQVVEMVVQAARYEGRLTAVRTLASRAKVEDGQTYSILRSSVRADSRLVHTAGI